MSRRARIRDRLAIGPQRYVLVAYAALATLVGIVFTGAAVRVTGSGLGCPEWPKCDTESIAPSESFDAPVLIEFGNRLLTGVVGFAAVAAVLFAWTRRPYRRELVLPAAILPAGVALQAVIGGISVLVDLDYRVVMLHYLVSALLLIPAVLLVWRATEREDRPRPAGAPDAHSSRWVRGLLASSFLSLLAGTAATAAGPHSGGEGTDDVVERLDLVGDDTISLVVTIHGIGAAVLGLSIVGAWVYARRRGASATLMRPLTVAAWLLAAQGVLGIVQYQLELPEGLVWIHVCMATVTWVVLVWAAFAAGPPRHGGSPPPVIVEPQAERDALVAGG